MRSKGDFQVRRISAVGDNMVTRCYKGKRQRSYTMPEPGPDDGQTFDF